MDLARDPQAAEGGHHRDREDDQLHRRFQPDQLGKRDDQQVEAEIADQRPVEAVEALQRRRLADLELDPVAGHMAGQVDQGRHFGEDERDRRDEHEGEREGAPFPPAPLFAPFHH